MALWFEVHRWHHFETSLPHYPLVICYIAIENGPIEIVDLPNEKKCDFPISFLYVYQAG